MATLSITAASVVPGSDAVKKSGVAFFTVTATTEIYTDTANSNVLKLCDADATSPAYVLEGVSLHAALSGQPLTYLNGGSWTVGATVAVATISVASATAGGICPSTDLASGMYTQIVGVAITSTTMKYIGVNSGVAVP